MYKYSNFLNIVTGILIFGIILLLSIGAFRCIPQTNNQKNYKFTTNMLKGANFADKISILRQYDFQRLINSIYFDYAKESLFTDSQLKSFGDDLSKNLYGNTHSESPSSELSTNVIEDLRRYILNFFGTTLSDYTVIFTYSSAQALKLIVESIPFDSNSVFYYSTSSNNDILGLRSLAKEKNSQLSSFNILNEKPSDFVSNSTNLITFPLIDEFDGTILNEEKIKEYSLLNSPDYSVFTLVDASLYITNHKLNLKETPFSAISISFDKLFGFPNLGAAIVKNSLFKYLNRPYFGGGTLVYALTKTNYEKIRIKPSDKFEDGSLPFLSLASVQYGFKLMESLGFDNIFLYIKEIKNKFYEKLLNIRYLTGSPVIKIYNNNSNSIITFNLLDKNNNILNYKDFLNYLNNKNIILSSGCMSTPISCYEKLGEKSLNGEIGAIRISIGWATIESDINQFINCIKNYIKE